MRASSLDLTLHILKFFSETFTMFSAILFFIIIYLFNLLFEVNLHHTKRIHITT